MAVWRAQWLEGLGESAGWGEVQTPRLNLEARAPKCSMIDIVSAGCHPENFLCQENTKGERPDNDAAWSCRVWPSGGLRDYTNLLRLRFHKVQG